MFATFDNMIATFNKTIFLCNIMLYKFEFAVTIIKYCFYIKCQFLYRGDAQMNYIVPEYYKQFKCKCGDCRNSCCDGWPIRITMKEYYQLLGLNCSENLRVRLDCALKLRHDLTHEASAQIATDWRGICMLHREDGFCSLQLELGENSLPEVCRNYPRNLKHLPDHNECSCSNSCEEVVELLMMQREPLKFIAMDLPIEPVFPIRLQQDKYDICQNAVHIIQDRSKPNNERFITLGSFLLGPDHFIQRTEDRSLAFQTLNEVVQYYTNSSSICDYCQEVIHYFGDGNEKSWTEATLEMNIQKYLSALKHIQTILPDWEILLEQLIVNHMFYNNFPYTEKSENVSDAYLSLLLTYAFLRFNILGYMYGKTDLNLLVDFIAAMFRLIEHSNFKSVTICLYKKYNYPTLDCMAQLLNV